MWHKRGREEENAGSNTATIPTVRLHTKQAKRHNTDGASSRPRQIREMAKQNTRFIQETDE